MGKRHGLQSADVAIDEFTLNSIYRSYGIVAVDNGECVIFIKADLYLSVSHSFTKEEANWSKTQITPIVHLYQLGTRVIDIGLWNVVLSGAGLVDRGRCFHFQSLVRTKLIVHPAPVLQPGFGFGQVCGSDPQGFLFQRTVKALNLALRLRMNGFSVDWANIQVHQKSFKGG